MGRPREYPDDRIAKTYRLSPSIAAKLSAAAHERDLSENRLVERALEEFLERLIPVDEIKWTRDV